MEPDWYVRARSAAAPLVAGDARGRKIRWVCARGGSIHSYFLIRETGAGGTKSEEEEKKRVPHRHTHGTSDKDADSPRGQHPNPSRKGSWHASRVHQARFVGATIQVTIAKGPLNGPTIFSQATITTAVTTVHWCRIKPRHSTFPLLG